MVCGVFLESCVSLIYTIVSPVYMIMTVKTLKIAQWYVVCAACSAFFTKIFAHLN